MEYEKIVEFKVEISVHSPIKQKQNDNNSSQKQRFMFPIFHLL